MQKIQKILETKNTNAKNTNECKIVKRKEKKIQKKEVKNYKKTQK